MTYVDDYPAGVAMANSIDTADNKLEKKQRILLAAKDLFLQHGLHGTSMSAVAKAAGVTKSLIYHHFASKIDLWQQVKHMYIPAYKSEQMALLSENPEVSQAVGLSLEAYFKYLTDNPDVRKFMDWRAVEAGSPSFFQSGLSESAIQYFLQQQKDGAIRQDVKPELVVIMIIAALERWFVLKNDFILNDVLDKNTKNLDQQYLQTVQNIILKGLLDPNPNPDSK